MKTLFLVSLLFSVSSMASVTWQQQAERLQKVSMALTEAIPVSTPIRNNSFDLYSEISILPKPSSTVGAKTEDTKTPPVHAAPSLRYNRNFTSSFSARAWLGILPPFLAGLVSEHTIFQILGGVEGQFKLPHGFYLPVGYQLSSSKVEGEITAVGSEDRLKSMAGIAYTGLGQGFEQWFWSFTFGARRNDSEFYIQEDATEFKFSDQLEENSIPLFYQGNMGLYYKSFTVAFSQLYIPNRLLMPKVTFSYSW